MFLQHWIFCDDKIHCVSQSSSASIETLQNKFISCQNISNVVVTVESHSNKSLNTFFCNYNA